MPDHSWGHQINAQPGENFTLADQETDCELADGAHRSVSVIVFEDAIHQVNSIVVAHRWFTQQNRAVEFIVISESETHLTPLSGSLRTERVQSLDSAIRKAKHEQIVVLDSVYQFKEIHWNLIEANPNSNAFRTWSFAQTRAPGSRRILAAFLTLIVLLLFGIRKTRLAPGMVAFNKCDLNGIDFQRLDSRSPDSVSQLLALAKATGKSIEEIRIGTRQPDTEWTKINTGEPHFPKSKSLKRSIKNTFQFWFCELAFPARKWPEARRTTRTWRSTVAVVATMVLAAILLFSNSGYSLFEPDETRNAQLALNIIESGDWVSLTLFGEPYWDKPPLLAWLTAISYKTFGVSEWSTRLPSIMASWLLVGFLIYAGSKLVGLRRAVIGAASLLLAWGFAFQSRYVTMDALLMLFATATTLGIAVGVENTGRRLYRRKWLIGAGIAMGLGILAKGPICVVLTAPPIIVWLFLNRTVSKKATRKALKLVVLPAVLVAAPWFILTSIRTPEFLWHFLWKHHVVRFSDAFNHQEPFWYYLPVGWVFMFPASILLPRVIYSAASQRQKHRQIRTPVHGLLFLSAVWIVGFFSISQCKLPAYILPALPMLALLTGVVLDSDLRRHTEKRTQFDRLPKRISIGLCALSLIAAILAWRLGSNIFEGLLIPAAAVIASIVVAILLPLRRSTPRNVSWLATSAIAFLFLFVGINIVTPTISNNRSILKSIASDPQQDSVPVVYFGRDSFASSMYLPNRDVAQFDEESLLKAKDWLLKNPRALIVASDENLERIQKAFAESASISRTSARHTFHISVYPERVASGIREESQR